MAHRTAGNSSRETYRRIAELIARWFDEHGDVLRAVVELREMAPGGDGAADAILAVPEIRRFYLSAGLFAEMAAHEGLDPTELLCDVLRGEWVEVLDAAVPEIGAASGRLHLVSVEQ